MKFLDGKTVGIDLGTSYSAIAHLDETGNPTVLKNSMGNAITASVVSLGHNNEVTVGLVDPAVADDPERIIIGIKRQMGNHDHFVNYGTKRLSPEFVSAMILRKLKQDAEQQIGRIANAVITVPYYFNEPCRKATRDAGQIAGLNVIDVINEPTAATLAYAWLKGELGRPDLVGEQKTILLYDLGGGTFDVTVVKYTPTQFTVQATDGDTFLGGLDWSQRIVEHVAEKFAKQTGVDVRNDAAALLELTQQCDGVKRQLSVEQHATVDVECLGRESTVSITRKDFERLTADLLQRTRDTTELVLEDSNTTPEQLDEILLVGGSTYMPIVVKMLKDVCGRVPSRTLDPQLAVAQGAAIHAAILEARTRGQSSQVSESVMSRLRSVKAVDVNSHSLGVEITDPKDTTAKRNHIMIPRNSHLPFSKHQRFVTNTANPKAIQIRLLEGEASDVKACTRVGDFRIKELPAGLPIGSPVEVTYQYDDRRRILVSAKELTGDREANVEIVWEGGLQDSGIDAYKRLSSDYQVR